MICRMEEFYKLVDRLNEFKHIKNIRLIELSGISGVDYARLRYLFTGRSTNITSEEIIKVAQALDMPLDEIDKIYSLGQNEEVAEATDDCECYIGIYLDCDSRVFMKLKDFYCEEKENFECFKFCPKCGKKIDWDAITENCYERRFDDEI